MPEFKFKNSQGRVITTSDVSTANDYRHREGFTEVKSSKKSDEKSGDSKSSTAAK